MFNSFSNGFFLHCAVCSEVKIDERQVQNCMGVSFYTASCKILLKKGQVTLFLKAITHFGGKFENNFVPLWHNKIYPI